MRSSQEAPKEHRIEQLDGLRALAILAVLIHHTLRIPLLWVGVDVFFVLSGFLITGILIRKKGGQDGYFSYFYERRAFRILTPYIVAICCAGLLFGWSVFKPWYAFVLPMMNFVGIYFPASATGLPLWSLAVEEQFYALWPFVVLKFSERTLLRIAIAVVILCPVLRFVATPLFATHFSIYYLTPFRSDLLCAGAALAIAVRQNSTRFATMCRQHAYKACIASFCLLIATQAFPVMRLTNNSRIANAVVYSIIVCGATALLAWALYGRGLLYKALMLRPLRFIGRISYSMYLMGTVIRVVILRYVQAPALVLILLLAASITWATISWYVLESPLLKYGAALTERRKHRRMALLTP